MTMMNENLKQVIESLKQSYQATAWWKYLQPEVQCAIEKLMNNIEDMGILFRDAFVALFKIEHHKRALSNLSKPSSEPSPVFGISLPEECYLSGIYPTKILFNLNDWIVPNDIDVNAAMILCQQIDVLESLGMIKSPFPDIRTQGLSRTNDLLRSVSPELKFPDLQNPDFKP